MPAFDPTAPTSELEAVNTMLVTLGQPPLPVGTDLSASTDGDVVTAINTLLKATRECLNAGWKFNTFYGREVPPAVTTNPVYWIPYGGTVSDRVEMNLFRVADSTITSTPILTWKLTKCAENGDLDMVDMKPTKLYPPVDLTLPLMFDRTHDRFGAEKTRYPRVFIDCLVAVPFDSMPESAKRYVAIRAARQFAAQVVGAPELVQFTAADEMDALRILKREQGLNEKLNFLSNSPDAWGWFGGRPYNVQGGSYKGVRRGGSS